MFATRLLSGSIWAHELEERMKAHLGKPQIVPDCAHL